MMSETRVMTDNQPSIAPSSPDSASDPSDTVDVSRLLLQQAQDGDMLAFTELQLLYEEALKRFCRRLIQDEETVADIVQDVFISFYKSLKRVDPDLPVKPYLFRIARNRCYDELRKWQRRSEDWSLDDELVQGRGSFIAADDQPSPEDTTAWVLLYIEVQEAINQLPAPQREALSLYSESGLSYAEIAEVVGISVGTAKSRVFYAKRNLRQYLHPDTLHILDAEFS